MKRKGIYIIIATVLVAALVATSTVYAKVARNTWFENKLKQGFSEDDVYSILAILKLSDENFSPAIEQKYEELKDWDMVAESYGINLTDFHMFVDSQKTIESRLDIPDDIYDEMIEEGMSNSQRRDFAMQTYNAKMDIETTWAAYKEGKTIADLVEERNANKTEIAQAATDLATGKINEMEYAKKVSALAPDMTATEITEYAEGVASDLVAMRTAASGITAEELAIGTRAGFSSVQQILELCRIKEAAELSTLSFEEMVEQVKNGASVDSVIKNNISQEKVELARKASESAVK